MEAGRQPSVPPGQTGQSSQAGWSQLAAGTSLFVGLLISFMGLGHLYGVVVTATSKGYGYDFRLAALLLVGIALVFGAHCASRRYAVSRAVNGLPGAAH